MSLCSVEPDDLHFAMHKVFLKPCNYELPRTPEIFDVVTNVYATTKVIAVEYAITYLLLTLQFQNKVKVPVDLQGCLSETTKYKRRF